VAVWRPVTPERGGMGIPTTVSATRQVDVEHASPSVDANNDKLVGRLDGPWIADQLPPRFSVDSANGAPRRELKTAVHEDVVGHVIALTPKLLDLGMATGGAQFAPPSFVCTRPATPPLFGE
jgi:hypothetical protein